MSIFDPVDRVPDAPTWRCPQCRTLQPESSRCRACGRSAVTCATCHFFRLSVVGEVGFCASDPTRAPMAGDEVRPCWVHDVVGRLPEGGLFPTAMPVAHTTGQGTRTMPAARARATAPTPMTAPVTATVTATAGHGPGGSPASDTSAPEALPTTERAERLGRLVEAPHVSPAGSLRSEALRRPRQAPG